MKGVLKRFPGILCVLLSLGGLLSCGLEAFYYIDYIPQGVMQDTTRATILLPSGSNEGYSAYFDHFMIFYRIYTSSINPTGEILTSDDRSAINSALNSDFNSIAPSTDITSTSVVTSNLENTFYNRKYFKLTLEGEEIDSVLSSRALGGTLVIWFPPNNGVQPTLALNESSTKTLQRNIENLMDPRPNRHFLNHPDLYDTANITDQHNADVATNSKADLRYTYVSMYIAAVGKSLEMPPRTIYSQPTFIGIFMLADWS